MTNRVVKICYFGDSITYGLGHDSKGVAITKRWTSLVDNALKKYEKEGIFVYSLNLGVNGDTTRNGLERLKDVYAFSPDIITIQFGMNDCNYWHSDNGLPRVNPISFKHNLIELIEKCHASKIKDIILSTNHLIPAKKLMLNGKDYNENNRHYNSLIREVATEKGLFFCDIETLFSQTKRNKSLLLDENGKWIHLSEEGNKLYAEKILPFVEETIIDLLK